MKETRISFIGCGNMGCSLIGGLIADGHNPDAIIGGEPDPARGSKIAERFGIRVYDDNMRAVAGSEVVILAVKPQYLVAVLDEIHAKLTESRALLISIAAGIRTAAIHTITGTDYPVVRVMPNTPALIKAGASALYASSKVTEDQRDQAEAIMRAVGLALWLDDEDLMDAVTALSGSGPAYFFLVMECMQSAAVKLGLTPEQARLLTLETAFGAAKMALESSSDVETLRGQVTSPGGTTEQALNVLMDEGQIEQLFFNAMHAAMKRSQELAKQFGKS